MENNVTVVDTGSQRHIAGGKASCRVTIMRPEIWKVVHNLAESLLRGQKLWKIAQNLAELSSKFYIHTPKRFEEWLKILHDNGTEGTENLKIEFSISLSASVQIFFVLVSAISSPLDVLFLSVSLVPPFQHLFNSVESCRHSLSNFPSPSFFSRWRFALVRKLTLHFSFVVSWSYFLHALVTILFSFILRVRIFAWFSSHQRVKPNFFKNFKFSAWDGTF